MEQEKGYKVTHNFYIAGVQFHELSTVINDLAEGDHLALTPEPSNKFDPNAIKIEYYGHNPESSSVMLGYVPKKFSSEVCAMLDVVKESDCVLVTLNKNAKPWEMAKVEIREML